MSTLSWERTAEVVIGEPGQTGSRFTDIRVSFTISKSTRSSANTASITVYNLADNNRQRMKTKDTTVALRVGYGGILEQLFLGQVVKGSVRWDPPDWIAQAECRDGGVALRESTFARSWPAGTPRLVVVRELTAALTGIAAGSVETTALAGALSDPLSVSGSVRKTLDRLALDWDFVWYIDDGVVEVRDPRRRSSGYASAVLLSPTTGLISSPEWNNDGLTVRALLCPRIRPGGYINVQARTVKGIFRVQSVTYSGDTHGQEWVTEAIAQEA